jgi:hypothetical protein
MVAFHEDMMAELVVRMGVGTALWDAQISDTVGEASRVFASASRFSEAFNLGIKKLQFAHQLTKYSTFLSGMMDRIRKAAENAPAPSPSTKVTTKEELESALRSLEYLYETNRRIYQKCEASRLTNNSMMAASLSNINSRTEQLLNVIDWIRCHIESVPSELDTLFADAREKLKNGEVYDLAELR